MAKETSIYQARIVADPTIMVGKLVVKGTRIPAELLLGELPTNPDLDALFAAYLRLTVEDIPACHDHAQALATGTSID